jgi:hypothetical protein
MRHLITLPKTVCPPYIERENTERTGNYRLQMCTFWFCHNKFCLSYTNAQWKKQVLIICQSFRCSVFSEWVTMYLNGPRSKSNYIGYIYCWLVRKEFFNLIYFQTSPNKNALLITVWIGKLLLSVESFLFVNLI